MGDVNEFRPDEWGEVKAAILQKIRDQVGEDGEEALQVAENVLEMGGSAMLNLIRRKCGIAAVCSKGQVSVVTPASSQLTVPGRREAPVALVLPITYKKDKGWTGSGKVAFIPDDTELAVSGR